MQPTAMSWSSRVAGARRAARLAFLLTFAVVLGVVATPVRAQAQCVSIGDSCDDGDPCTSDDRCVGVCIGEICVGNECAGTPGCDDGDACTDDSCEAGSSLSCECQRDGGIQVPGTRACPSSGHYYDNPCRCAGGSK